MLINAALIADSLTPPFIKNYRKDLTAADIVSGGAGKYVLADISPASGNVLVIKAIVPYAQKRIAVGVAAQEDFEMMSAVEGNGHFLFQPQINGGAFLLESNLNIPTPIGTPPLNEPPNIASAIDCISENPYFDCLRCLDSTVFHIVVNDSGRLQIVFSLAETNMGGAITIGGLTNHRVDFAGVYIGGAEINKQRYDEMVRAARTGK